MRKISRKGWIKKLDKLVSEIVIKRDKHCIICGSTKQLGAGHLFSRRFYNGRWDLDNVFAQCWACNFKHTKDPYPYWNWYIKKFGLRKFNKLAEKVRQITHFKDHQLQEMYEKLSNGNSSKENYDFGISKVTELED